jgi:hypothetical protein
MARLEMSAAIHPLDIHYLLVAIEDESGTPVADLKAGDFSVRMWAGTGQAAGSSGMHVPVVAVSDFPVTGTPGFFYTVLLGDIHFTERQHKSTAPLDAFGPLVYGVSVDRNSDHGEAIACACCKPAGKSAAAR